MDSYKRIEEIFEEIYRFQHFVALGNWDAKVTMPKKGGKARGEAMAVLNRHIHSMTTSQEMRDCIAAAEAAVDQMNEVEQANLREAKRIVHEQSCLPAEYVMRRTKAVQESQQVWAVARAQNDFQMFLPHLKKMVELAREEARYRGGNTDRSPYAALFEAREPGMTLEQLELVFDDIKSWLPQLIKQVIEKRKDRDASMIMPTGPYPLSQQVPFNEDMARLWGYDFDMGRLDVSEHPFTGMVKEDSRVTNHYSVDDYEEGVFGTIHEVGHSKYETHMGPMEKRGQPVCNARSAGVHESQSLFQEFVLGRSGGIAEYMVPYLKQYFGDQPAFTEENVHKLNQRVVPGFIRIKAEELCYNMHVVMRYEIERPLIEGTLQAEDVPRVWNEKMQEYFGLSTEGRDDIGCLQDIHWSGGGFGGFPGYSIGSIFSAQLMATIKQELGEDVVEKCIHTGRLQPIFDKQNEKIWSKGCMYTHGELIEKATGEPLTTKYLREHLERRYLRNED